MTLTFRRQPSDTDDETPKLAKIREWHEPPPKATKPESFDRPAGPLGRHEVWVANGLDPGLGILGAANQLAGFNPFLSGSGVPTLGPPVARHATSNATVCWHPFEWIAQGLINNPNLFVLANLGVGKSALIKRIAIGLICWGLKLLVLGDVKNEYGSLVEQFGGQRWRIGHGVGSINPLDRSDAEQAAKRLRANNQSEAAAALERGSATRRAALMGAIAGITLNRPINAPERVVLAAILPRCHSIGDFIHQLEAPGLVKAEGLDQGARDSIYYAIRAVVSGGLHGLFSDESSQQIDLEAPAMQIDVSEVYADGDEDATALAMLAVWTTSFGVVAANEALAKAGLAERAQWFGVLDELWMAMRSSEALVRSIDAVMRTSRTLGIAPAMSTHSVKDFHSLPTESARQIAHGFLVRSGTRFLGSVERDEADSLQEMLGLTDAEKNWLVGGRATGSWQRAGTKHPSLGRFLLHTGQGQPSLPVQVHLSELELELFDTNRRT